MSKINIGVLDIYPQMITDAYELCEEILKDYGYTEQDFFSYVQQDMDEFELKDLSNRLVRMMFNITRDLILQKKPDEDVDYYVNGTLDTHFYINGEQM